MVGETAETGVESTVAVTRVPPEPALTSVPVAAAGDDAEAEAETCDGVALTVVCAETAGAETVADAEAAGDAVLELVDALALAAGVLADAEVAELAAGPLLTLVVAEALAAGVLTLALTDADGVADTETFADAALETFGVCGTPGSPFAFAGRAEARQPATHTAVQMAKR